ncbi:c-type cytochrome [Paenibacillus thermotolerans]|uniref:c-type cytochrome n=1 Tax=Paenibacillus thermotolerans TaxID=3027807 RepID=UPI002368B7F3|nr:MULTISPECIES: cytochrome c [unclassified Paenibacillus]
MKLKKLWLLAGCMALAGAVAACGGGGNNNANQPAAPSENTGQTGGNTTETTDDLEAQAMPIYEANCLACHAADMSGGGSFPNLQAVGGRLNADEIHNRISNGGNGMPAFKGVITDEEIQTLTDWLSTKK